MALITNNTSFVPRFQSQMPQAYFRNIARRAATLEGLAADASDAVDMTTRLNAEAYYATNLYRQLRGETPLPQTMAPSVNVGLDKNTQMLVVMGLGAVILYGLYKRKAG